MKSVAVIGAGWSGAACARLLSDAEIRVDVFESAPVIGGHSRSEALGGVVYEPNGAHIFHTSDSEVNDFVRRFGMSRPYEHRVLTQVFDSDGTPHLLSWPPQVSELEGLRSWPEIQKEISQLPDQPIGMNFEEYVISMMGETLYQMFIYGYTLKQWERDPKTLATSIAPKRIELRRDGYRRLFRDPWEYFEEGGVASIIERVLQNSSIVCNATVNVNDLDDLAKRYSAIVITAPLDIFMNQSNLLEWRGISIRASLHHLESPAATLTPSYVVNYPSLDVPYTRTVETKHATGQQIAATVVGEEFSSARGRHYPIPTANSQFEHVNAELKEQIRKISPVPVYFCGRLAEYVYINQDQAIRQGIDTARVLLGSATETVESP